MNLPSREEYQLRWNEAKQRGNELQLHVKSAKDLLDEEFPPTEWIVEKLIPANSVTVISGSPASFKTWLYMDIAVRVAHGETVFGNFKSTQSNVLVVDEESGWSRMYKRFRQLGLTDDTPLSFMSSSRYKLEPIYVEAIINEAHRCNARLVVFDSLIRFSTAKDENSSQEMATVMDYFNQLADAGLAVIVLHHNRKENVSYSGRTSNNMRGSSEILAAPDCHISVSRKEGSEFVTLEQTKNRDEWESAPFELRFSENASQFEYVGAVRSKSQNHLELLEEVKNAVAGSPGASKRQLTDLLIQQGINAREKKISDLLEELVKSDALEKQRGQRNSYEYYLVENNDSSLKTQ